MESTQDPLQLEKCAAFPPVRLAASRDAHAHGSPHHSAPSHNHHIFFAPHTDVLRVGFFDRVCMHGYVCTSPTGGRRVGQANQAANVHPVRCLPALLWHKGTSVFERRVKTYVSGKRDCADDAIGLASTERLEGPWSGSGSWMAETFSTVVHYIHSENTTDLAHSREPGDR